MRRLTLLLFLSMAVTGQDARFEAAALKPVASAVYRPSLQGPNDEHLYSAAGNTVLNLLRVGYGDAYTVVADSKKFPWIQDTYYSVSATIPKGVGRGKIPEMMQHLLKERFGLEYHTDSVDQKGFNLVLIDGDRLRRKAVYVGENLSDDPKSIPPGYLDGSRQYVRVPRVTMKELSMALRDLVRGPVVDQTGVDGSFSFWIETERGADLGDGMSPEIINSLRDYGLALRSATVTVRRLLVDKINKVPTEN
jgi:uncharacterized protein (TIGR03435 family)